MYSKKVPSHVAIADVCTYVQQYSETYTKPYRSCRTFRTPWMVEPIVAVRLGVCTAIQTCAVKTGVYSG